MFAGISTFFWNQNQSLQQENSVVSNKIKLLEENMKEQLEDVRNQFIVLNNPQTKKYNVIGIIEEAGDQQKLMALPYAENAVGYITIEQKGGNHAPSVENIVANIAY